MRSKELRMSTQYPGQSPYRLVEDTEEAWRQHDNPEIEPNPEAWDPS